MYSTTNSPLRTGSAARRPHPRPWVGNGCARGMRSKWNGRLEHAAPEGHVRASQNVLLLRFKHPAPHAVRASGGAGDASAAAAGGGRTLAHWHTADASFGTGLGGLHVTHSERRKRT